MTPVQEIPDAAPAGLQTQTDVFAFLTEPATYGGSRVHRIDTHAASVFLAGHRALKIKRAVRFPFLDYSTLEKRKAACEEELRINSVFAPQIYLRVVAITRGRDGSLSIAGGGMPVEWAVEMRRFDERQTVDHLAEAGPISPGLGCKVADAIAAGHAAAPTAPSDPWLRSIPSIISANTRAFTSAECFDRRGIDDLDRESQATFTRLRPLLEQRARSGFVRHCHGDLHLANIVVIDRNPVLFDAIEFDPVMASTDVLYDLAFPIMDLIHYGSIDAANALLNRYLTHTDSANLDGLSAMPLFLSIRAAIRANVRFAQYKQKGEHDEHSFQRLQAYFSDALRLIMPQRPQVIAIGGLSGTGKSVLARSLASSIPPLPGAIVVRSDSIRKQLFNVRDTDRLPNEAYQPATTERVYRLIAESAARILAQGYSVVADAVFAKNAERTMIADAVSALQVSFTGLFLTTDLETRMRRVGTRSADASDATPAIARLQEQYELGSLRWNIIDASGSPAETLSRSKPHILRRP